MIEIVAPEIEEYAQRCTTAPPALFDELRQVTYAKMELPQMQVGHLEGTFLQLLVRLSSARRGVEVGMFTGYSTLMMAGGLPDDGELITCEINPEAEAIARQFFGRSPDGRKIQVRMGPARETLRTIQGPIDFAFLDADKVSYVDYYEALVPLLRPGGWIAADNTLWNGLVVQDPGEQDEDTRALVGFSRHVAADDRVVQALLTIRDGITLIWKK